jgi:hypothetical protein
MFALGSREPDQKSADHIPGIPGCVYDLHVPEVKRIANFRLNCIGCFVALFEHTNRSGVSPMVNVRITL